MSEGPRWTIDKGRPFDIQIRLQGDPNKDDARIRVAQNGEPVWDEPLVSWSLTIDPAGRHVTLKAEGAGLRGLTPFLQDSYTTDEHGRMVLRKVNSDSEDPGLVAK